MHYKLAVFGAKDTTAKIIQYIKEELREPLDLVVTVDASVTQKNHIAGFSALDTLAKAHGIAVFAADTYALNSPACTHFFTENTFELGICIGWQRLIPKPVLDAFKHGIFGFHGSCAYLPFGRGRSPLNWSLVLGDERYVLNMFRYDEQADSPNVFSSLMFDINAHDTIRSLQYKNLLCSKMQIAELLKAYHTGAITVNTQSCDPDSWYVKRTANDGKLDFTTMRTREAYNLIRAVTRPFPGAFCQCGDVPVTIWEAVPFDSRLDFSAFAPGQVIDSFDDHPIVRTLDGSLLIKSYEAEKTLEKGMLLT